MEAVPGQQRWREEGEVRGHGGVGADSPVQAGGMGVVGVYRREGETWGRSQPVSRCWWMPTLPSFGTSGRDGAGSTAN